MLCLPDDASWLASAKWPILGNSSQLSWPVVGALLIERGFGIDERPVTKFSQAYQLERDPFVVMFRASIARMLSLKGQRFIEGKFNQTCSQASVPAVMDRSASQIPSKASGITEDQEMVEVALRYRTGTDSMTSPKKESVTCNWWIVAYKTVSRQN